MLGELVPQCPGHFRGFDATNYCRRMDGNQPFDGDDRLRSSIGSERYRAAYLIQRHRDSALSGAC